MRPKATSGRRARNRASSVKPAARKEYLLRLYVAGASGKSIRAISNIKRICEKHLSGRYSLKVIDVYKHPEITRTEQIIAAPTLVKCRPGPSKRWIGDLTKTERILAELEPLPPDMA